MRNKLSIIESNMLPCEYITRIDVFRPVVQYIIANTDMVKWFQHCLACIIVCMKEKICMKEQICAEDEIV